MNERRAPAVLSRRRSVLAKIVGEIDRRFVDIEQCLGRSALGINHVMAFELDVVVLQLVASNWLIAGDGGPVDQHFSWRQYAVDQHAMARRNVEIGMRHVVRKRRARDANRQRVLDPWLRRIAPCDWIASNPLNGAQSAKHRWQKIADHQILDFALALGRPDLRSLQGTIGLTSAPTSVVRRGMCNDVAYNTDKSERGVTRLRSSGVNFP